jgi:2-polyprenyl-3-methyl-5-hydroxy-6-metoxy-1,4-benzoquinol methylase
MDAPGLDPAVYERVLRDLARVNRWTFTAWPSIAFLNRAIGSVKRFRLLDIAYGDGDILRAIGRWPGAVLSKQSWSVSTSTRRACRLRGLLPRRNLRSITAGDYLHQAGPFDFIICSQVAHHMTDEQLTTLLRYMEAEARLGWLVCDLHRHCFAYHAFPLLARLLRVHRITREDGRLSIARSFRLDEWKAALQQAGTAADQIRIVRRFSFRLCVERLG